MVVTPTVELNALAMKRGEPTVYSFLVPPKPGSNLPLSTTTVISAQSAVATNVQDEQKLQNSESSNLVVNGVTTQIASSKSSSQLYNQR